MVEQMKVKAIAPWFDITKYAVSLVRDGTLRIDTEGRVWRDYDRSLGTKQQNGGWASRD
ncbi:hypothetical protein LCGC14_2159600 [marine sediment metagenome]|uniref:Uncharacterized protein n=1 Tax=marine sediment metagenome TaxID=412755 RepID=A0A0F9EFE5_9ZZZZ